MHDVHVEHSCGWVMEGYSGDGGIMVGGGYSVDGR